mgnify:CR=1 FL=1
MRSVFDARRPGLIHLDGLTQRVDILGYIGKMILRRKMQSAFYTPQRCAKAFREPLSMRKPLKSIGIIQDNAGRNLIKHFLMWPEFLPGAKADLDSGAVIADCVDMFLAHYAATVQAA